MNFAKKRERGLSGASIAELAVMLPLFFVLGLGGAALVASIGMFMDYKLKLANTAQAGALVYMNTGQWQGAARPGMTASQINTIVQTAVQNCATQKGLGPVTAVISNASASPDADGLSYVTVTVTAANLSLLPLGSSIPTSLAGLSDSVTFAFGNQNPIALAYVVGGDTPADPFLSGPGGVLMPAYGGGVRFNPVTITNNLSVPLPTSQLIEYFETDGGYRPI